VWPDPSVGAAIWLLPVEEGDSSAAEAAKIASLSEILGTAGLEAYRGIVDFMKPRAAAAIGDAAWYLSIVGIAPRAQGHGIGARLLEPTLAEADSAGVECYLETFDSRNPRFYERLGFSTVGTHLEPITGAPYAIMRRPLTMRPKSL
jgi:GNAT superfamily N-acetyltransferase